MPIYHLDNGVIKGKAKRTDSGFIFADSVLTRTGIFTYRNNDGTARKELRLPEEVFNSDSMESLKMVPATHGHPPQIFVTPENAKDLQVGHVGENVRKDGNDLMAPVMVTDLKTIESIESGNKDISCGYSCELDFTPGEFMGERYDAIQRNIKYNHVAVGIPRGRAGNAKINLDNMDAVSVQENIEEKGGVMPDLKKINLDGIEYEAEAPVLTALNDAKKRIDELETENKKLSTEKTEVEAKLDSAKEDLEKAKAVDVNALVKERVELVETAKKHLDADTDFSEMSDMDVKKAVVAKRYPKANLDGKDEVYISARFDAAIEDEPTSQEKETLEKPKAVVKNDSVSARDKMIARMTGNEEDK